MGVDFISDHGDTSFNWPAWRGCFELALAFGWKPAGTVAPCDYDGPGRWDGTYFRNDLQAVTDEDASALAVALRRALAAQRAGTLTAEQAKAWACEDVDVVGRLAEYAEKGHFAIL
jgi:hypothetical protein